MNTDDIGPVTDCNCIYMPYGDGASFSGYRKVWVLLNISVYIQSMFSIKVSLN